MAIQPIREGNLTIDLDKLSAYDRVIMITAYNPGDEACTSRFSEIPAGARHDKYGLLIMYNVAPTIPSLWDMQRNNARYELDARYRMFSYESEEFRDLEYRRCEKIWERHTKSRLSEFKEQQLAYVAAINSQNQQPRRS